MSPVIPLQIYRILRAIRCARPPHAGVAVGGWLRWPAPQPDAPVRIAPVHDRTRGDTTAIQKKFSAPATAPMDAVSDQAYRAEARMAHRTCQYDVALVTDGSGRCPRALLSVSAVTSRRWESAFRASPSSSSCPLRMRVGSRRFPALEPSLSPVYGGTCEWLTPTEQHTGVPRL